MSVDHRVATSFVQAARNAAEIVDRHGLDRVTGADEAKVALLHLSGVLRMALAMLGFDEDEALAAALEHLARVGSQDSAAREFLSGFGYVPEEQGVERG